MRIILFENMYDILEIHFGKSLPTKIVEVIERFHGPVYIGYPDTTPIGFLAIFQSHTTHM